MHKQCGKQRSRPAISALISLVCLIIGTGRVHAQFSAKISFGPPLEEIDLTANKYLQQTKDFADFMVSSGRDNSGIFAGTIDLETHAISGKPDPNDDQDVYRTMHMLSLISGDRKYTEAADESFESFLWTRQCKNSFFNWGEGGCVGEESSPMLLHDEMYRMAPFKTNRYARTYWFGCIGDKSKGYFNRHCGSTIIGGDYPKHGGFFLQIWAEALLRTGRRYFADYIKTVFGFYDSERTVDGVIPYTSKQNPNRTHQKALRMSIGFNVDAWKAMLLLDGEEKREMLEGILLSDTTAIALGEPGVQPVIAAYPIGRASVIWNCYDRYVQLHNWGQHDIAERYKTAILESVDGVVDTLPDPEYRTETCEKKNDATAAVIYGTAIYSLVLCHRLDPNGGYLEAAAKWADQAINTLFEGPLYGANHSCPYTTNQVYIGSVALGLFTLGTEMASPQTRYHLPNTAR